jgi:hypothetical protein
MNSELKFTSRLLLLAEQLESTNSYAVCDQLLFQKLNAS